MPEPPRGFRGVFLWTPRWAGLAAGVRVPADRVAAALAAITAADGPGPTPIAGIVVLGRWLGSKPADMSWAVHEVAASDSGCTVRMDGAVVLEVRRPSDAVLTPGPYGMLFVIPTARDVIVTVHGQSDGWLPSVRDGIAHDMRGNPARWPHRKEPGVRSPFAPKQDVPALMLSVWHARGLPPDLAPQAG